MGMACVAEATVRPATRTTPAHRQLVERLESMERVVDMLVLVLVFVLAAAMLYGLATASGTADWLN